MMKEHYVSFVINRDERKMLEEVVMFEPFPQDNLRKIKKKDKDMWITFDAYDLFDTVHALQCLRKDDDLQFEKLKLFHFITKLISHLNLVRESGQELGM